MNYYITEKHQRNKSCKDIKCINSNKTCKKQDCYYQQLYDCPNGCYWDYRLMQQGKMIHRGVFMNKASIFRDLTNMKEYLIEAYEKTI